MICTMPNIMLAAALAAPAIGSMPANGSRSLEDGLVAYWRFDEGSGTVAHDSTSHGHDAQILGAEWGTGISGACLSFDGLDDYVMVNPFTGALRRR